LAPPATGAPAFALGRSVSIDQAARLLAVSRRTVYNRIREGRLKTVRTIGGSQRVLVASIHELLPRPTASPPAAVTVATGPRGSNLQP
jgi:excisionase family DNA binding protein